jgi:hypothetical protein
MCASEKTEPGDASSSPEDIADLNAAFDFLYSGLRDAKKLFEAGDKGGREGAIHALEILAKFLSRFQPVLDEGLNAPLAGLFNALLNLDDGAVLPLLKPVPTLGRTRASAIRDSLKGAAAFTVARLCAIGQAAPEARADVAQVFREAGVTAARGRYPAITNRTVRGWCEAVAGDIGRHGEAAQTFDLMEKECLPPDGPTPADIRRHYLAKLAELIGATRGAER